MSPRPSLVETLGLRPFGKTLTEVRVALAGDAQTPKTRYDTSSLRQFQPRWSVPLWLGHKPAGRRIPLTNLFNHLQPPPEDGWSVRVTRVRDHRGGANTYDSHNGTDFAIPPGTEVVTAAAGIVVRVSSEFHRGGRKVFVDHGGGLVTSYNHLARPLVAPGERIARGQTIALSGYSGIDAVVGFPWTPPHVHFNVWLGGHYVDPFARQGSGEPSLWRSADDPLPCPIEEARRGASEHAPTPSAWSERAIDRLVEACRHDEARRELESARGPERWGVALFQKTYFPTRFSREALGQDFSLFETVEPRTPRLDLPFSARDYDGVVFPDRGPARG